MEYKRVKGWISWMHKGWSLQSHNCQWTWVRALVFAIPWQPNCAFTPTIHPATHTEHSHTTSASLNLCTWSPFVTSTLTPTFNFIFIPAISPFYCGCCQECESDTPIPLRHFIKALPLDITHQQQEISNTPCQSNQCLPCHNSLSLIKLGSWLMMTLSTLPLLGVTQCTSLRGSPLKEVCGKVLQGPFVSHCINRESFQVTDQIQWLSLSCLTQVVSITATKMQMSL